MLIPKLFVALDPKNRKKYDLIKHHPDVGFKINVDEIMIGGLDTIPKHVPNLFLDLKIANGPRELEIIFKYIQMHLPNVIVVTVDVSVGYSNIARMQQKLGERPLLAATTVLTHYDDSYAQEIAGKTYKDLLLDRIYTADSSGVKAIIMPANYLHEVEHLSIMKITPGVRLLSELDVVSTVPQKQLTSVGNCKSATSVVMGTSIFVGDPNVRINNVISRINNLRDT